MKHAAEIEKEAAPDSVATRIGGDEFGVVLPVNYDVVTVRRMRAHFGSGIACSIGTADSPIFISASVGFALYPNDGITAGYLFRAANKSMHTH